MNPLPLALALTMALSTSLFGQGNPIVAAPETLWITEGGARRLMEVARDEVLLENANGLARFDTFPAKGNAGELMAHCRGIAGITGEKAKLVVYEAGTTKNEFTRRVVTHQILLRLRDGADPVRLARAHGAVVKPTPATMPGWFIFELSDPLDCLAIAATLRADADVIDAEPILARKRRKKAVPNDPKFNEQWHLKNTGQLSGTPGIDINVVSVWGAFGGAGIRGSGVRIGIVDDGIELTHPDLAANVDTSIDYDWNDNTPLDASAEPNHQDDHGTPVSGLAGARGNNGLGVSGVAPEATLVSLRLVSFEDPQGITDLDTGEAMLHRNDVIEIKNNSWGPDDDGKTLEGPGPMTAAAFVQAATLGRGGLGTILTWAAGNGLGAGDNANKDGFANSIYTIAVGGVDVDGTQAYFSEPGACMVVTAPSEAVVFIDSLTTTDLTGSNGDTNGDYTNLFGGTSATTPVVSGVVALILEANPALGWRDIQEILMRSATKNDAGDGDWIVNGDGFNFNHKYGAGMVNAQAAITLANTWTNLAPQAMSTVSHAALNASIPNNNATGINTAFDFSATDIRVEHVTVTVDIRHNSRGHLAVTLTSPDGTVSRLVEKHGDKGDHYPDWTFMTVANWGESSTGTWTLKVADLQGGDAGTLNSAEVTLYGAPNTYRVSGAVTEKVSGAPLPGVTVAAGAASAITNGAGAYEIDGLAAGSYSVAATLADHTSAVAMVNVGPDATNVDFGLRGPLNLLDPDHDTAVNLQETAFFMNSLQSDAHRLPQAISVNVSGTDYPAVTYRRLKGGAGTAGVDYAVDGISYRVEISYNLVDWVFGETEVEVVSVADDGNGVTETVVVRPEVIPGVADVCFRVRITYTP